MTLELGKFCAVLCEKRNSTAKWKLWDYVRFCPKVLMLVPVGAWKVYENTDCWRLSLGFSLLKLDTLVSEVLSFYATLSTKLEKEKSGVWSWNRYIMLRIIWDFRYLRKLFVNNSIEIHRLNNLGFCFNSIACLIRSIFKELFWRKAWMALWHEPVKVMLIPTYLYQKSFSLYACYMTWWTTEELLGFGH